MPERFKNITTWLVAFEIKVLAALMAPPRLSPVSKSGTVEGVDLRIKLELEWINL
jgi:hypothetical protein